MKPMELLENSFSYLMKIIELKAETAKQACGRRAHTHERT